MVESEIRSIIIMKCAEVFNQADICEDVYRSLPGTEAAIYIAYFLKMFCSVCTPSTLIAIPMQYMYSEPRPFRVEVGAHAGADVN